MKDKYNINTYCTPKEGDQQGHQEMERCPYGHISKTDIYIDLM